jgi:hypothetical protein
VDVAEASPPSPMDVPHPPPYPRITERADTTFGLRPASTGGFGGIVMGPSHG